MFAARDFGPGEVISSVSGITFTTTPRSPPWKRWAMIVGTTSDGRQLFWDEEGEGSGEYWSNFLDHRREPNVRYSIDIEGGRASLSAVVPIKAGEELFLDYKEYHSGNWAPD
ncbi:MAG: SET domain-containing protein [Nitrososphaerales archaeon]